VTQKQDIVDKVVLCQLWCADKAFRDQPDVKSAFCSQQKQGSSTTACLSLCNEHPPIHHPTQLGFSRPPFFFLTARSS